MRSFPPCLLLLLFLLIPLARAELILVPADSSRLVWSAGLGLGVPYGVLGGAVAVGVDAVCLQAGAGIVPQVWKPAFSGSVMVYLKGRYATLRPKFTVSFSNIVAAAVITKGEIGDNLYEETFPGMAAYLGVDWRTSRMSQFTLDLNIGWTFPFVGTNEIQKRFDDAQDYWRQHGYVMSDKKLLLDYPKISLGVAYSPSGRMSKRLRP